MFLGAFGLKDPLRDNVKSVVNAIQHKGNVKVRMISGDHHKTACEIARKAGIITYEDLKKEDVIMDAEKFRMAVGQIDQTQVGNEIKCTVENEEKFMELADRIKVLTRANSDDKLLMTVGLKNMNRMVAVTGDGINDIDALEMADVGLAMGTGCSAAKNASELILTDDDFESAIRAVMWGRNIYQNVGRFL